MNYLFLIKKSLSYSFIQLSTQSKTQTNPNQNLGFNLGLSWIWVGLGDLGDNILLLCLGEEFGFYGIIWFIKEFLIRKFCNKVYIFIMWFW